MTERRFEPLDRLAAWMYRSSQGHVPYPILKRLGIATPRRRIEFFTLNQLISTMPEVRGSVLECGAYQGATLLGMTHALDQRGLRPRVFALDSFEGFPEPTPEDAREDGSFHPEVREGGLGDSSYERLLARIRLLGWSDRITVIKGYFEDTLPRLAEERFSIVHMDCDLYSSHMTCLNFVYPRMLPGGCIVFDDYASPLYTGGAIAVDEFFRDKPEELEHLPNVPDDGSNRPELHRQGVRYFVRIAGRDR